MRGQIQKWGNSLAIRIPKVYADELNWDQATPVQTTIIDGKLIIEAVVKPKYTLEYLLEGMTPDDEQNEFDTGPAVGNEVW